MLQTQYDNGGGKLNLPEIRGLGGCQESARSGRVHRTLDAVDRFEGAYERPVDLAQGRFALIGKTKEFALVLWLPEIERLRGRMVTVRRTGKGIEWTLGRPRGIGR